jgi:PAS domain S-box-containing protein
LSAPEPPPPGQDFADIYWRAPIALGRSLAALPADRLGPDDLRLLTQYLPTLCSISSANGATIWCNRRWFDYSGMSAAQMANDGWQSAHDPAELPDFKRRWSDAVQDGKAFEMVIRLRGADGVFRPFLTRVWPLHDAAGAVIRWLVVSTEIGAQVAAEAALRVESSAHQALLATQQAIAAAEGDEARMLQAVVSGALDICAQADGVAIQMLRDGKLIYDAVAGTATPCAGMRMPADAYLSGACLTLARAVVSGDVYEDARADHATAQALGVRSMVVVPILRRGKPAGVLKFNAAITDAFGERDIAAAQLLAGALAAGFADAAEARAAAALRESEARFQLMTNSVNHMVWSATEAGNADYFSDQWRAFLGYDPSANAEIRLGDVVHPDDLKQLRRAWLASVASGEIYENEHRLRHHSGTYRWVIGRATRLPAQDGRPARWFGTTTDIHDRREAENALREMNETLEAKIAHEVAERAKTEAAFRQAQKMEAVGQLTGGIAHDFNNLLTVVAGNIDIATRAITGAAVDPRALRALDSAMKGAERAAALTQRLLAFARLQPLAPQAVDIARLVTGMSDLLNRALGETIKLNVHTPPGLWQVEADRNQLENAILNLAVNARDAMANGGTLTIAAQNASVDVREAVLYAGFRAGDYTMISVLDTGIGMPPEVMARVFEPFFTTKEVGRGTGLGLSQVYGFVKQSGGYIRVNSEPGRGTIVRVYLPRLAAEVEDIPPAPTAHAPVDTVNRETILVVEDDDDVRAFTVACVSELGYSVLQAPEGQTALNLVQDLGGEIDLLFTDIVMPGMSGVDLATAATALQPHLRVLFTSGYTRDAMGSHARAGADMLTKPFTFAALASKLREVLDMAQVEA